MECTDLITGEDFSIGSGLDDETRARLWKVKQSSLIGSVITYKFVGLTINKKPRNPVFKGFRDAADMDPK